MNEDTIVIMLKSIRETSLVGAKYGNHEIGDRVDFAFSKDLIRRLETGSFALTQKGDDLLDGKIKWKDI